MAALRFLTGQMDAFEVNDVSAAAASVSVCRAGDQEDQKHLVEIAQLLHPSESRLHVMSCHVIPVPRQCNLYGTQLYKTTFCDLSFL